MLRAVCFLKPAILAWALRERVHEQESWSFLLPGVWKVNAVSMSFQTYFRMKTYESKYFSSKNVKT